MSAGSSIVNVNDDFMASIEKKIEEEENNGDELYFEALKLSDETIEDRDIILIPIETDENGNDVLAFGKNKVFDRFVQLNEEVAHHFLFINETGDCDGWIPETEHIGNLFIDVGFPKHKQSIVAHLDDICHVSSNGLKQAFFDIAGYNKKSSEADRLIPNKDYTPFCPFKSISREFVLINKIKYFRFPGSFYKAYKDLYFQHDLIFEILLLGVTGRTYGSLFDQKLPFENKAHYLELTDPLVPLFLSLTRKYDFAYFDRDTTDPQKWMINTSLTHPTLVRLYARNQEFVNEFMEELQVREATFEDEQNNPFVITSKDKNGVYHLKISVLFMEHVVAKKLGISELSENFKKVTAMNISFAKQERYICQKIEFSEESPDQNRPFYLIIENSIYEKNMPLVKKYFDC